MRDRCPCRVLEQPLGEGEGGDSLASMCTLVTFRSLAPCYHMVL